jgi:AraC-like DNA-binding protein
MQLSLKRKVAGAAAGLALVAGAAGGAYAVSNRASSGDRQAFLNDVAKRLNVSPQKLKDAFAGALDDRLAADVKAGRITQAQADEIKRHASEHGGVPFLGPPPGPGGPGGPGGPPPFGGPPRFGGPPPGAPGPIMAGLDAAAKYLGLTDPQLRTRLRSGKSLAQVASDQSKPLPGLKSAIEAAVKKDLDQAVAGKRITKAQEGQILSELHGRLDEIVNRKPGDRPRFGARLRRGPHW